MGKRRSKSAKAKKWKYQLSIGIIFKNEIRCLERCLTSLLPLKESLSCEIVMADTGSTDGSREIAEKYADILFDFPWINDFAAARNAVLKRCSGEWFLYPDCDEWLEDVAPLARFLNGEPNPAIDRAMITQRNYVQATLGEQCSDVLVERLFRAASKPHFEGIIHEHLVFGQAEVRTVILNGVILHHDGYVCLNDGSREGVEKFQRNIRLLRVQMERDRDNLRTLYEFLDSDYHEPDYPEYLKRAVSLIVGKAPGWADYGPLILSRATIQAPRFSDRKACAELAERMFPNSYFVRLDVNCELCYEANHRNDFAECVRRGKAFLSARKDASADSRALRESALAPLRRNNGFVEKIVRILILRAAAMRNADTLPNCVRELRLILQDAPELKDIIEGVLSEIQRNAPPSEISPELRELAEKVRTILSAYPPDDPAVVALKATPAYQKVAHLL